MPRSEEQPRIQNGSERLETACLSGCSELRDKALWYHREKDKSPWHEENKPGERGVTVNMVGLAV